MNKPYDFIPFLKCETYTEKGTLEGTIPLKIKTLTPIHISSGKHGINDGKHIYKPFTRITDEIVIFGTSLKGLVRSISEAISYSCFAPSYGLDRKKMPNNKSHNKDDSCIVCDMFGKMGKKSKIQFSDCYITRGRTELIGLPASFSPRPNTQAYIDRNGNYKGHKFYRHGILGIQQKGDILYEYVLENAEFEGDIRFERLTEEQLQLLCFSLGLSGEIQPKIGFGKAHYYGSISIESKEEWAEKAKKYKNTQKTDVSRNILKAIEILSFSNAVKSLE